jgi:hypothetical protein
VRFSCWTKRTYRFHVPGCVIDITEYYYYFFFIWIVGGWSPNWVQSARRPLTGLLYLPRVIVRMENLVEWMAGKTDATLSTTNPIWPDQGLNPSRGGKPATNRFSYGAANNGVRWQYYYADLYWNAENFKCIQTNLKYSNRNVSSIRFEPYEVYHRVRYQNNTSSMETMQPTFLLHTHTSSPAKLIFFILYLNYTKKLMAYDLIHGLGRWDCASVVTGLDLIWHLCFCCLLL